MGSQEPSTQGSEVEDEDCTNSEEESELEALRLAALITKKENDPDRKVLFSCSCLCRSQSTCAKITAYTNPTIFVYRIEIDKVGGGGGQGG